MDLETRLAAATDPKQRIDLLNQLADALRGKDIQQAIELTQQASQLSLQGAFIDRTYLRGLAVSQFQLGQFLREVNRFDQAIQHLLEAQRLFEQVGTPLEKSKVLNLLGLNYLSLSAFAESLEYFLSALKIFHELGEKNQEAEVLNNIGSLYLFLADYQKATSYLFRSLDSAKVTNHKRCEADALNNLCSAYCSLNDYQKAIDFGLRSASIFQEIGCLTGQVEVLNSVGDAYLSMRDFAQALAFFQLAQDVSEKIDHKVELARAWQKMSDVYLQLNRLDLALNFASRALITTRKIGDKKQQYECYQKLALIYKKQNDFEKALAHFEQFVAIRQEVFNEESDSRLKRLEVIHQLERIRKDAEISHLRNVALQQEIEERKRAETQLRDLATSDPLTGLFNRRHFFSLAERELVRSRFLGTSMAVILMDLDHFKLINDTHGHLVGDKVLMAVAHNIEAIIRDTDLACRYGGDEFILLLPETELLAAKKVADRLRRSILVHPVHSERGSISIKASLGVVGISGKNELTLEDLLAQADRALYQAKESGRNRVIIAS